jgi:hypothetical protein
MKISHLLGFTFKVASILLLWSACTNNDINRTFDCTNTDLEISLGTKSTTTNCNVADGSITVAAAKGKEPYSFRINGGAYQTSPTFANLTAGSHNVEVKDANQCLKNITVTIDAANSTLDATTTVVNNTGCTSPNGSITVKGSGGAPPYLYSIDAGAFGSANSFAGLNAGTYSIKIKDASECQKTFGIAVSKESTGIKYSANIKPILDKSCNLAGCHVSGGRPPDLTKYATVFSQRAQVKSQTANRSMPPGGVQALTADEIAAIACWVDDGGLNN